MAALALTPAEQRAHRAGAHHLAPVVFIGSDGLTDAVAREVDRALAAHGLIKVRAMVGDRAEREAMFAALAGRLGAAPVQHIGKLFVLWRPLPPEPAAERGDRGGAPRFVRLVKFPKSGNHRPLVKKVKVLGNQRITAGGKIKRARTRSASVKKSPG